MNMKSVIIIIFLAVFNLLLIVIPNTSGFKNFIGNSKGFSGCISCGDTWNWKKSHSTDYGPVESASEKYQITIQSGCHPMCEECWASSTPEERLPHYMKLVDRWEEDFLEEDVESETKKKQMERYEQKRKWIKAAVLNGR